VQVSTDGGKTYHSLANADTTCDLDPGADAKLKNNCPGFNGDSGGWVSESFDLSAYAGTTCCSRSGTSRTRTRAGPACGSTTSSWAGTVLADGTSLDGWQTFTQIKPIKVSGYTVQLIAYDTTKSNGDAFVHAIPISQNFQGSTRRQDDQEVHRQEGRCGRRPRHVRRADGVDQPVRAVHAEGERRDPAGRLSREASRSDAKGGHAAALRRSRTKVAGLEPEVVRQALGDQRAVAGFRVALDAEDGGRFERQLSARATRSTRSRISSR
jgi:hypothetical protein